MRLYQLSNEDVETVVATWCAAFPHTAAYLAAYDLVLIGADTSFDDNISPASLDGLSVGEIVEVSGFFTAMLWRKRGLWSLMKHRFKRRKTKLGIDRPAGRILHRQVCAAPRYQGAAAVSPRSGGRSCHARGNSGSA